MQPLVTFFLRKLGREVLGSGTKGRWELNLNTAGRVLYLGVVCMIPIAAAL